MIVVNDIYIYKYGNIYIYIYIYVHIYIYIYIHVLSRIRFSPRRVVFVSMVPQLQALTLASAGSFRPHGIASFELKIL